MSLSQTPRVPSSHGLKVLVLIQTACSIISVLALVVIANVRGEFLPTPSCPKWINPFNLSVETKQLCWDERIDLYEPAWAIPLFVTSASVGATCLLGIMVLNLRKASTHSLSDDKRLVKYQIILGGVTCVLYVAIFIFAPIIAEWIPGPTPMMFK